MKVMKRLVGAVALVGGVACSSNPTIEGPPPWVIYATNAGAPSKIDLLFAIDNSPSMGDKQSILASAVPAFLNRLISPNCVDAENAHPVPNDGQSCATLPGTHLEFAPIRDMHIAIVSSSLGGGGSPDVCVPDSTDSTHQDDGAHLLNRTASGPLANATPKSGSGGNFLAWLPSSTSASPDVTPYTQPAQLISDFQSLVTGVGETGCVLEAQLESWYRFLIQPDPYASIALSQDNPPKASLVGVDQTVIAMRHDFLRPDSIVAIVQLTDEEDSWSDPMWLGGYGWTARTENFPNGPGMGVGPRGTSECDAPVDETDDTGGPNDPDCVSCAFPTSNKPVSGTPIGDDPNCQSCVGGGTNCTNGWYAAPSATTNAAQADGLNVRYGSQYMRARYGFDNQFNEQRYVDGLRLTTVPDSAHEVHDYTQYASQERNCTNPLFAAQLPDGSDTTPATLCDIPLGARTPNMVFYTLIGGVSPELVTDANDDFVAQLTASEWQAILGKDPTHYVFDGIDPHMIESTSPRTGIEAPGPLYNLGTDPENGREWNTLTSSQGIDLEYACTFALPTPHDCSSGADPSCECFGTESTTPDGPPLCDPQTRTTQTRGKAYPSIRELRVAHDLAQQAVVGTICSTDDSAPLGALVDGMRTVLGGSCLPKDVPQSGCELISVFASQTNQSAGCTDAGLAQPSQEVLEALNAQDSATVGEVACVVDSVDCASSSPGWCMTASATCNEEVAFSPAWTQPSGTQLLLICPVVSSADE